MKEVNLILENKSRFLKYLKSKYTLIHLSNIFFRDMHYGLMDYLKEYGKKVNYTEAEKVTREVCETFEKEGILKKINNRTWMLNYPEFALPQVEKKAS